MDHNFIENNLIILSKQTLDLFLSQQNPADLIALYVFYYYTAKWQKTNQPKCSTGYVSNGLNKSESWVRQTKKQLITLGLVEDFQQKDEKGVVTGWFIKLNYVWKQETIVNNTLNPIHPTENPQGGETHRVEKQETNALSANSLNTLSANSLNIYGPCEEPTRTEKVKPVKAKFTPPTFQEAQNYYFEKYKGTFSFTDWWEYYSVSEWKKGNGKRVLNWKLTMTTWKHNHQDKNGQQGEKTFDRYKQFTV